jgi:hypothetical protein
MLEQIGLGKHQVEVLVEGDHLVIRRCGIARRSMNCWISVSRRTGRSQLIGGPMSTRNRPE